MKPGPTGEFPEGKLDPSDEGELGIRITLLADVIHVEFGTSVRWLALGADDAESLGRTLVKMAKKLRHARSDA